MSPFDDGYVCDDPYETNFRPDLLAWSDDDNLTPEPPDGWLIVHGISADSSAYELCFWVGLIEYLQADEIEAGTRRFMIARHGETSRFIMVHPDLKTEMEDYLEGAYSHQESCGCDDGTPGGRHIWRLTKNRAKRNFKMMSIDEAVSFLTHMGEPHLAFEGMAAIMTEENEDIIYDLARE